MTLFAAACYLLGDYADIAALRKLVAGQGGELTATMLARRTQTNEAARRATLLRGCRTRRPRCCPGFPRTCGTWSLRAHPGR